MTDFLNSVISGFNFLAGCLSSAILFALFLRLLGLEFMFKIEKREDQLQDEEASEPQSETEKTDRQI